MCEHSSVEFCNNVGNISVIYCNNVGVCVLYHFQLFCRVEILINSAGLCFHFSIYVFVLLLYFSLPYILTLQCPMYTHDI